MIKTQPWTGGTDEEYETQHFGFGAQRLKISVRQMVEQAITTGVNQMETYLHEALQSNSTDKAILSYSCEKLVRLFSERAEPSLAAIDKEIEMLLKVPANVLLAEDEVQLHEATQEDYDKLKEEVESLRKRVERAALMEALLSAEDEEISSVESVCKAAKKDIEVSDLLHKSYENNNELKNIINETESLCSSAPFMNQKDSDKIFLE